MSEETGDPRSAGQRLRRHREAAGLTQQELADSSGLSVRAVNNLERGQTRRPHPRSIRQLIRAMGLPEAAAQELLAQYRAGQVRTPPPSRRPDRGVPRQLPPAIVSFAGRTAELSQLDRWLEQAFRSGSAGTVMISVIGGMAGVGKSTLALCWAHRVAHQFPDGQLYVNLRGYDSGGHPARTADVIRGFLDALDVAPEEAPVDLDAQVALYRSLLADRRMLILADNARDAAQVRPLLPAAPHSMVLVTSRGLLDDLAATDGAEVLPLGLLPESEAAELLSARLGADAIAAEPAAAAQLINLCGRLPLALAIAAARAAVSGWPVPAITAEIADAGPRLGGLRSFDAGDAGVGVRAVFSWSYQQLSGAAARMFRLLAVHPGPEIAVRAAASLAGLPAPETLGLLRQMADVGLIAEVAPGRYALHDLVRAYAGQRAELDSTAGERLAAAQRMTGYYTRAAQTAARMLDPDQPAPVPDPRLPGVAAEQFAGVDQAMAWFAAEYQVLLTLAARPVAAGDDGPAWQLARPLTSYFYRFSRWESHLASEQIALAHTTVDQANLVRAHLAETEDLSVRRDDRSDEAQAHLARSVLLWKEGDIAAAGSTGLRALELAEADGSLALMSKACNNLGHFHAVQGDAARALPYCQRAVDLAGEAGDPVAEAYACHTLGYAYSRMGDQYLAGISYRRASSLFKQTSHRYLSAMSLDSLGDSYHRAGNASEAVGTWRQALDILDDLAHPDASEIRRKIHDSDPECAGPM